MVAWFFLNWLFLVGLYIAFAGKIAAAEIAVALCGGLATAAYLLVVSRSGRPFSSGIIQAIELAPRIVWSACRDMGKLTVAFLKLIVTARVPHGSFVEIAFDPGRGDAPSRRRRGLVIAGNSFAPNAYVVAIRHAKRRLVLHGLLPPGERKDMQWPL